MPNMEDEQTSEGYWAFLWRNLRPGAFRQRLPWFVLAWRAVGIGGLMWPLGIFVYVPWVTSAPEWAALAWWPLAIVDLLVVTGVEFAFRRMLVRRRCRP